MREKAEPVTGTRVAGPTRSMEALSAGDWVRIEAILLEPLRVLCAEIGIREGDAVRCRSATPTLLLLDPPAGHIVALPRDRARFIRVSDLPRLERRAS